ncbi:hypothetical protein [Gemmata massiliana]|nr:hypothetical protein [Gemmata massiliana]
MFTKRTRTPPVKCPACLEPCFWFNGKDGRELVCPNCTCFAPTF